VSRAIRTSALLATVLAGAATPARANPADVFGLGARGAAMGGAQTATVDDSTASYYNPARLTATDDIHIDLGYQMAAPSVGTEGGDFPVDRSEGLALGIAVPGKIAGQRLAIGASLFLPDQQVTRTRTLPAERPRFLAYDNRPQRILLAATAAVELFRGLSIGAGVAYMASTNGEVELRGLVGFPDPTGSDLDLSIDVDVQTIRYPHAGIAWQALPWLSFGVSYRGGFRLVIDQTVRVRGDIGAPGQPVVVEDGRLDLRSVSQDLFQPMQVTAGVAAQVLPNWLVALDLAYQRWSEFDNPTARIDIELDIKQFNDLVAIPPMRPLAVPNLHDIIVPRLGVEWRSDPGGRRVWSARGGYVFEPRVAPEQAGESNFIDNDKHTLTAGGGLELPGLGGVITKPFSIDAYVSFTYLVPRLHEKLNPIDPVGDYTSRGHVIAGGIMSRWRF
jgi:long-subunit fatty acid transport protein